MARRAVITLEDAWDRLLGSIDALDAELVDIDTALEESDVLITLVAPDVFKVIPPEERTGKKVYDTRGIWPDVA